MVGQVGGGSQRLQVGKEELLTLELGLNSGGIGLSWQVPFQFPRAVLKVSFNSSHFP